LGSPSSDGPSGPSSTLRVSGVAMSRLLSLS